MKQLLKSTVKFALAGVVLAGLGILVIEAPRLHQNYLLNNIGRSVVMITNKDGRHGGTGFMVEAPSGKKYILTNAHICVGIPDPMIVTFKEHRQVPLKIVEVSNETDLCLIEAVGNMPALELASSLSVGETLGVVGHPALMALTLTKGELIEFTKIAIPVPPEFCERSRQIGGPFVETGDSYFTCGAIIKNAGMTTVSILGGNSGSPTINWRGQVVGVLFAGRSDGAGWGIIIPLQDVQEFLKVY